MTPPAQKNAGFTIVEIVTTILIMGILVVGISSLFVWGFRVWRASDEQARAIDRFQEAYQKTVSEIREMQTASSGAYPIESATTTQLIFYANVDADDARERMRLTLSGDNLIRGIIQPTGSPATYPSNTETTAIIGKYIRNAAIFSYYDQSFTGSQSPMSPININTIRLIKLFLSIDIDPNQPPAAIDLSTYISLRNLKQNL